MSSDAGGFQGGGEAGDGLWARVWRPLEPALEEEVVTELTSAIRGMLTAIEQQAAHDAAGGVEEAGEAEERRQRRWRRRQALASHVRGSEACALNAALRVLTDVYPRP